MGNSLKVSSVDVITTLSLPEHGLFPEWVGAFLKISRISTDFFVRNRFFWMPYLQKLWKKNPIFISLRNCNLIKSNIICFLSID